MTLAEALDLVVARTGHARYRDLCDPTHPDYDPGYEGLVMQLAVDATRDPTIEDGLRAWWAESVSFWGGAPRRCCGGGRGRG